MPSDVNSGIQHICENNISLCPLAPLTGMEYYVWNQGTESGHQYLTVASRNIALHDSEIVLWLLKSLRFGLLV